MTKLEFKHIVVIDQAIKVFETGLEDDREKKYHADLRKDIVLLNQAREILLAMFQNPTLPFSNSEPSLAKSILNDIA